MQLNYKEIGEGKPIIILHGLFGMLDNWQTFGNNLAEFGFRVILIDQRDHGKSPWTSEFNYDVLANDIIDFAQSLELDSFFLLGHSMGGKTAMAVAKLRPDLIEKLIIVDVAPKQYRRGHDEIFAALRALDLYNSKSRTALYESLKIHLDEEMVIQFLLKNIQRNPETGGFSIKFNLDLLEKCYENIIDDIYIKEPILVDTLFCKGDRSRYIVESDEEKIYREFNHAQIVTIEQAGHWVHADQPEKLLDIVVDFIG